MDPIVICLVSWVCVMVSMGFLAPHFARKILKLKWFDDRYVFDFRINGLVSPIMPIFCVLGILSSICALMLRQWRDAWWMIRFSLTILPVIALSTLLIPIYLCLPAYLLVAWAGRKAKQPLSHWLQRRLEKKRLTLRKRIAEYTRFGNYRVATFTESSLDDPSTAQRLLNCGGLSNELEQTVQEYRTVCARLAENQR